MLTTNLDDVSVDKALAIKIAEPYQKSPPTRKWKKITDSVCVAAVTQMRLGNS
ncbi:hypothetical protein [Coleofasciculus sp.]|uniref:hypothetical protein n=1 Tax=Coleofasciculus sp. TaxID=3100458 RepID=UPI0040638F62